MFDLSRTYNPRNPSLAALATCTLCRGTHLNTQVFIAAPNRAAQGSGETPAVVEME